MALPPHTVPLIIDGKPVIDDTSDNTFTGNPHTGQASWTVQGATQALAKKAVDSCSAAFVNWSQTQPSDRRELFLKLGQVLRNRSDELANIIQEELCSTELWADINVADTIAVAEQVASLAFADPLREVVPEIREPQSHGVIFKVPLGVVLGIAPWNAPAILGLRAVAAAVMAGNCAILKGSELSPRTHYFIANTFVEAGFPPGVVNFLLHRPEDAVFIYETLISHPAVKKCNFTGSTAVGKQVAMRAAFYVKPVLLELGGKNYAIVLDDADLGRATDHILEGGLLNSGQICMSTDIVLASTRVGSELCEMLRAKLQKSSKAHVTYLINKKSEIRIEALSKDAEAKGAQITIASLPSPVTSTNIASSGQQSARIIENITSDMKFWEQESFGPLIGIASCDNLDEAIRIVNESAYGLSAAIFSKQGTSLIDQAKSLEVGAVHINGSTVHDEAVLPHGGCKASGWGRFGGHWALEEFLQTRTVISNI